eukprot:scaffold57240_cov69-Phaeocystis_antarctica.AAC.1
MLNPAMSTPKPRPKRRPTVHSRRRAGRGCMARPPRQHSVGASAPAAAKSSAASRRPTSVADMTAMFSGRAPASVATMMSAPNPDHKTTPVAHTTRIARASVGKRARARRQRPSGSGTSHQKRLPMATSTDWPVENMTDGIALITSKAHPACPMAKLTRSRRPAADDRAARNTLLTAADLAAPEKDREGEVGSPWTPALDSASAPRRSRRQPAIPRSSRVGSRAIAMAAMKAIDVRRLRSRWL